MRIEEVREEVRKAVKAKEPILLYGKSGVGKTSVVYDVARELEMEVSEINSSLCRDESVIQLIKVQVQNGTLMPTILLLDEVDGFAHIKKLSEILNSQLKVSVVMTANNLTREIMDYLRGIVKMIYVSEPEFADVGFVQVKDFRQAELIKRGVSDGYFDLSEEEEIEQALQTGDFTTLGYSKEIIEKLLDASAQHLQGFHALAFVFALKVCDDVKDLRVLNGMKVKRR
ncbi:MAG: AAA family ATPase [Candidatus Thorarchaeota archaeon]